MQNEVDTRETENWKSKNSKGAVPKSSVARTYKEPAVISDSSKLLKNTKATSKNDSLRKIDEINKIANAPLDVEMPEFEQDDSTTALLKADNLLRITKQQLLDVQLAVEETKTSPKINTEKMSISPSHTSDNSPQHERGIVSATIKGAVGDYKAHFLAGPLDSGKERGYQDQDKNNYNCVTKTTDRQHTNEKYPLHEEMLKTKHSVKEALNAAKGVSNILSDRPIPDLEKSFHNLNNGAYIYEEDYFKRNIRAQDNVPYFGYGQMPVLKEQMTITDKSKFFGTYDEINAMPCKVEHPSFCTNCSPAHPLGATIPIQKVNPASKHCECENYHRNTLPQAKIWQQKVQFSQQNTYRNPEGKSSVRNYNACSCKIQKNVSGFEGMSPKANSSVCTCQENKSVLNVEGNSPKTNCNCINDCTCKKRKITSDFQEKSPRTNCNCVKPCTSICRKKNNTSNIQASPTNYLKVCDSKKDKSISDMQRKSIKCLCQNNCTCGENTHYTKCSNSAMIHLKTCIGGKEIPEIEKLCSEGKLITQELPSLSIKRNLSVQKIPTVRIPPPGAPPYVSATKNVALWGVSHSQLELDLWDCSPSPRGKKSDDEVKQKSSKCYERKPSCSCEEPVIYKKKKTSNSSNLVFQTMPAVELGYGVCDKENGYISEKEIQSGHCLLCNNNSQVESNKDNVFQERSSKSPQTSSEQHKANCKKCKNIFFLKDLYCGVCKYCFNLSIRNEISRMCMATVSPDIVKAATHLGQCDECHRYFPIIELFQGHCIACQVTKKEVRLYQCDTCLNSIPSTEYFEGKCGRCYQMLMYGSRNDRTVPTDLTMVQQSLQSVFNGTPFLFDLNMAQGINRTACTAKSTCEVRRQDATFTKYPTAGGKEINRPRSLVKEGERKFDVSNKISDSKDERSSTSSEVTRKDHVSDINKTVSYITRSTKRETEPIRISGNNIVMARESDSLNKSIHSDSSKEHTEISEKHPASKIKCKSKVRYIIDIDKDSSFEDVDVLNSLIDVDRRNLNNLPARSVQFKDSALENIGTQENLDPVSLIYHKSGKGNDEVSAASDGMKFMVMERNTVKHRTTPYFGKKEAKHLSHLFSSLIQKSKDSDLDEDRKSSTASIQSESEENLNKVSQWENLRLSSAIKDVLESDEGSENTISEPMPKGTSMINKSTLSKNVYKEKLEISDESLNNSENKSDQFSNVIEKSPKKGKERQTTDDKIAESQTVSLLLGDVLERRYSTKNDTHKSISDLMYGEEIFKHTAPKMKPGICFLMEEHDKYKFSSDESDQEDEDTRGMRENRKLENDSVKDNLESDLGSSHTSGTDAKIEEGSAGDDKTTITEGDDIYEDDWEEETDKGDSDSKSIGRGDIGSDIGVTREVKTSNEDKEDSTASSSFPKSESENNEQEIHSKKNLYVKNILTSSKTPLKLRTNYIVQTLQTQTFTQKPSKTSKKKIQTTQEKSPEVSFIPEVPCDEVHKKKHTLEDKNVMKCSETSAILKKFPSDKIYLMKHVEKDPVSQVRREKYSGTCVKQKKVNHHEVNKKSTSQVKKTTKYPITSDITENDSLDQMYGAEHVDLNFPCVKKHTKYPFNISCAVDPTYQLETNGKCTTFLCKKDKGINVALPSSVKTIDVSTSPICINLTDTGTSVTNLMAENLVERETSPIKISYLDNSTSPLALPAMIDEQLSSVNLPAGNLINDETSSVPVSSVELIYKSTSPIRNFLPEKTNKGTSVYCVANNFRDSETSPIQSEECICGSASTMNVFVPEKLDKNISVICLSRNLTDKGTSPIHSIEALCKTASAISISIPEKVDRNTSVIHIPRNLVDKETSPVQLTECVCEATVSTSIPPQEKEGTLLVCECATCSNLIPDQTVRKSDLKKDIPCKSKCSKECSSNELVSYCKLADTRREFEESQVKIQSESDGEPVDCNLCKGKKTEKFTQVPSMMKHGQEEDSELSDDAVKSISHEQIMLSEGEIQLSCSVCSLEEMDDVSASFTKNTVTNPFSTGEVFSCQSFEVCCACSEGEIAKDHRRYKHYSSDASAAQTKAGVQLLMSSSLEDVWESSEESQGHRNEEKHDRKYKDCASHYFNCKGCYSEGELNSEELSDGQILNVGKMSLPKGK